MICATSLGLFFWTDSRKIEFLPAITHSTDAVGAAVLAGMDLVVNLAKVAGSQEHTAE